MKDLAFQELLTSVRQAGRIRRGTMKASRTTVFRPADVKTIRVSLGASQSEFALMIGVSGNSAELGAGAAYPGRPSARAPPRGCEESEGCREALHGKKRGAS